jgi:hypothetical protein
MTLDTLSIFDTRRTDEVDLPIPGERIHRSLRRSRHVYYRLELPIALQHQSHSNDGRGSAPLLSLSMLALQHQSHSNDGRGSAPLLSLSMLALQHQSHSNDGRGSAPLLSLSMFLLAPLSSLSIHAACRPRRWILVCHDGSR